MLPEMLEHFDSVAGTYRTLRITDEAPVNFIARYRKGGSSLLVADVGCGTGRYSELLAHKLHGLKALLCIDAHQSMLQELEALRRMRQIHKLDPLLASAEALPLDDGSIHTLVSFNAIHHFDLDAFLGEVRRVLVPHGLLFLYTRLRKQNATHVWGRYFPGFHQKENRLYNLPALKARIQRWLGPDSVRAIPFKYERKETLDNVLARTQGKHYSTFRLYQPDEFTYALHEFERRLVSVYPDPDHITWTDEYTLFIASKDTNLGP